MHLFGYVALSVLLSEMYYWNVNVYGCTVTLKCQNCFISESHDHRNRLTGHSESSCVALLSTYHTVAFATDNDCHVATSSTRYQGYRTTTKTYRNVPCFIGCYDVTMVHDDNKKIDSSVQLDHVKAGFNHDQCISYCLDLTHNGTDSTCTHTGNNTCYVYTSCSNGNCPLNSDSNWDVYQITCDITLTKCSVPSAPGNGTVTYTGIIEGNTATYTCNTGYTIDVATPRTCVSGGTWDGNQPTCTPVNCSTPWQLANGTVTVSSTTYLGEAVYQCHTGYTLSGSSLIVCHTDGNWNGTQPICNPVPCSSPVTITNGNHTVTSAVYQGTVTYGCDTGYNLSGESTLTCDANGTWNGTVPQCVQINCGSPPTVADGNYTTTSMVYMGTAHYSCVVGYNLIGDSTLICDASGNWNGIAPQCVQINCGSPPTVADGKYTATSMLYMETAEYSCNIGYNISGMSTLICDASGNWNGTAPQCNIVECGQPVSLVNGNITVTSIEYQGIATYWCDEGYNISGQSKLTCDANGVWNGTTPQCGIVDCGQPTDLTNGNFTVTSTEYQGTVNYWCNEGYNLTGQSTLTCDANGIWNGILPQCDIINCVQPVGLTDGNFTLTSTQYQGIATYYCYAGYNFTGQSKLTCDATGNWDGLVPVCDPVDCYSPPSLQYGNVTSNGTTYLHTAHYTCDMGYVLNGIETRMCQHDGQWSESAPVCVVDCGVPADITNGEVSYNTTYIDSVAIYTCHNVCTIYDTSQTTCHSNGSWSVPTPTCSCPECPPLSNPLHGEIITPNSNTMGSVASYKCDQDYLMHGSRERACNISGLWTSREPTCEYVTPVYIASCLCNENREFAGMTEDEIISQLVEDTQIDTKKTAQAEQKLKSSDDDRQSSAIIGTTGVAIIASILGIIVLLDCLTLWGKRCKRRKSRINIR